MTDGKPGKSGRQLGATGEAVRQNIRRVRDRQGVSGAQLSAQMKALDRPIPPLGIQRIESGERRVDVDDLAAFAVALGVSPVTLLMPNGADATGQVHTTGYAEPIAAEALWRWLVAIENLEGEPDWLWHPERSPWPTWLHVRVVAEQRQRMQESANEIEDLLHGRKRMGHGDDQ